MPFVCASAEYRISALAGSNAPGMDFFQTQWYSFQLLPQLLCAVRTQDQMQGIKFTFKSPFTSFTEGSADEGWLINQCNSQLSHSCIMIS